MNIRWTGPRTSLTNRPYKSDLLKLNVSFKYSSLITLQVYGVYSPAIHRVHVYQSSNLHHITSVLTLDTPNFTYKCPRLLVSNTLLTSIQIHSPSIDKQHPPFPANLQANSPSTSLQVYHLPRPSTSRPPPPTLACFRASNRRERERPCIIQIRLLCKETPAGILSPMVSLLVDVFLSLLGNFRFCS